MSKPLPGAIDLIKDTWKLFTTTWNDTVKISIWFLYFGLLNFVLALLDRFAPTMSLFISFPLQIALIVVAVWVSIRLIRAVLKLEAGGKMDLSNEESTNAWKLLLPMMLTGSLQIVIIFGGTLLFIVPGIYLAIALSYSSLFVIDRGLRNFQAIKASYVLVKGRWWATLWRELAAGFVFAIGLVIVVGLVQMLLTVLSLGASAAFSGSESVSATPMFKATMDLFSSIVEAATLPLFIILRVKIYRALERTRSE